MKIRNVYILPRPRLLSVKSCHHFLSELGKQLSCSRISTNYFIIYFIHGNIFLKCCGHTAALSDGITDEGTSC